MDRHPHILNAASNLLGICFVIITGLRITRMSGHTLGDEFAWIAAFLFLAAILLSFIHLRRGVLSRWVSMATDYIFLSGIIVLTPAAFATSRELA
ncbi:MAG: hypothetical protein CGW95_14755 [Phenylobacterium zucineum]|nr:MAG: hypothetical protein CGW95_14755 [Phenylobacterium zucineum]